MIRARAPPTTRNTRARPRNALPTALWSLPLAPLPNEGAGGACSSLGAGSATSSPVPVVSVKAIAADAIQPGLGPSSRERVHHGGGDGATCPPMALGPRPLVRRAAGR